MKINNLFKGPISSIMPPRFTELEKNEVLVKENDYEQMKKVILGK
jgi:pyruvoyl-dependent arginine decarboxylase (PvlArgDC)